MVIGLLAILGISFFIVPYSDKQKKERSKEVKKMDLVRDSFNLILSLCIDQAADTLVQMVSLWL